MNGHRMTGDWSAELVSSHESADPLGMRAHRRSQSSWRTPLTRPSPIVRPARIIVAKAALDINSVDLGDQLEEAPILHVSVPDRR